MVIGSKYIKSYKMFESKNTEDIIWLMKDHQRRSLLKEMCEYFNKQEYNFDLIKNPKGFKNIIYQGDIFEIFIFNKTVTVCYPGNTLITIGSSPKFPEADDLNTILELIYKRNKALVRAICNYLFGKSIVVPNLNTSHFNEICERIKEFEVIKDNKLDEISLNNLFDFYEKDFDFEKVKQLFESNNSSFDQIIDHFRNQEFNLDIKLTTMGRNIKKYSFKYDSKDYILTSIQSSTLYLNELIGSQQTKKVEISNDITTNLLSIMKEISKRNSALINTIGHKIFGEIYYLDMNETLIQEIIERMREFDVIRNYKLDTISLNNLFDFYNKEYDEDLFDNHYQYRLTFNNG